MKTEYEFKQGKRGAVLKTSSGKARITIRIDEDILQWFRSQVHAVGGGTINQALREHIEGDAMTLGETLLAVIREELAQYGKTPDSGLKKRSRKPL
jgi:hypothetical protein